MRYTDEYINDINLVTENIPDYEKFKGSEILITGATGLICSAVADILLYLNKNRDFGMKIYLAGRNENGMIERFAGFEEGRDYHFVSYDATKQLSEMISADYIIHGASNADPARISGEPVETILANVMGLNKKKKNKQQKKKTQRILFTCSLLFQNYTQEGDLSL